MCAWRRGCSAVRRSDVGSQHGPVFLVRVGGRQLIALEEQRHSRFWRALAAERRQDCAIKHRHITHHLGALERRRGCRGNRTGVRRFCRGEAGTCGRLESSDCNRWSEKERISRAWSHSRQAKMAPNKKGLPLACVFKCSLNAAHVDLDISHTGLNTSHTGLDTSHTGLKHFYFLKSVFRYFF